MELIIPAGIQTYNKDGRLSVEKLYDSYLRLSKEFDFILENVYQPEKSDLPVISLRTKKTGNALWLLAGIHGEEPAGSVAISKNADFLGKLGEKIPLVIFPLCNPSGYSKDWRYPNEIRDEEKGKSVGDSDHLLPDLKNPSKPRTEKPVCPEAEALTAKVLELTREYPPILVFDFHEDEDVSGEDPYLYFLGENGAEDSVALEVVQILKNNGFSLQADGETRFGEKIKNGMVVSVNDGSVDELLASKEIILNGETIKGPSAKKVMTIETRIVGVPLGKRVEAHSAILHSVVRFWEMSI